MKEAENIAINKGKNYEYLMKNARNLYFEDMYSLLSGLNSVLNVFSPSKEETDTIDTDSKKIAELNYETYSKYFLDQKRKTHIFTQDSKDNLTLMPNEAYDDYFTIVGRAIDMLDGFEKKFPNKNSSQRKLLSLIKNHIKIITEYPDYIDALNQFPDYTSIMQSVFLTFPSILYKNANGEYEPDQAKFDKFLNNTRILEVAEMAQEFFIHQTIPYVGAVKNNTLTPIHVANYKAAYNNYIGMSDRKLDDINDCDKKEDYIKNNYVFKAGTDFDINYKTRFADLLMKGNDKAKKLVKNGWPLSDIPMLRDIMNWYENAERVSKLKPGDKGYSKDQVEKSLTIVGSISDEYELLINAPVNDNKTRTKLLTEFNERFINCQKLQSSNRGLVPETIEKLASRECNDIEFTNNSLKKAQEVREHIFNTMINSYDKAGDPKDKYLTLMNYNLYKRSRDYIIQEGNYASLSRLSKEGIDCSGEATKDAIIDAHTYKNILSCYPHDFDGLWQMFFELGRINAEHMVEAGENAREYEKYVDANDPLRDMKLRFITMNCSIGAQKCSIDQGIYEELFLSGDDQMYLDAIIDKLESEGKRLSDVTVDEFFRVFGVEDNSDNIRDSFKEDQYYMNLIDVVKENLTRQGNEVRDNKINSELAAIAKKAFALSATFTGRKSYVKNLSEDKKAAYEEAKWYTDKSLTTKLDKFRDKDENYRKWYFSDGTAIVEEIIQKDSYNMVKQGAAYYGSDHIYEDTPLEFADNARRIRTMVKRLDDNTHWYKGGSSKNFDKMFDAFKKLSKHADKLSGINRKPTESEIMEYAKLAGEVDRLATFYLDNKTPSNSEYAKVRVSLVKEIRADIRNNISQFNKIYLEDYEKEDIRLNNENTNQIKHAYDVHLNTGANVNKFMITSNEAHKIYKGAKYANVDLGKLKTGSFSASRLSAFSLAMFALLGEVDKDGKNKYTYDDVMDNTKLAKEKSEKFDEIINKMKESASDDKNVSDAARKWIAELIYKGQKMSYKIADEEIAKLGKFDEETLKSDKMIKLRSLAVAQFDAWQEMAHCKNEIVSLAKNDGLNVDSYEDYKDYVTMHNGALSDYNEVIDKLWGPNILKDYEVNSSGFQSFVFGAMKIKFIQGYMNEYLKTDRKVPYSEWYGTTDALSAINLVYNGAQDLVRFLQECKDEELKRYVTDNIANGSIFANIKYNKNHDENFVIDIAKDTSNIPIEEGRFDHLRGDMYTGYPTVAQVYKDYKVHTMKPEDIIAKLDETSEKIDKEAAICTDDVSRAMHSSAKWAVSKLSSLITEGRPLQGQYLAEAKLAINKIVSYNFMKEFKKKGVEGEKLTYAVAEAMKYSSEYDKNTEYIGKSAIYDFAFTNLASNIVKKSSKSMFMGEARVSLENLKHDDYKNREDAFIKDSAYAIAAQQLRVNKELIDPKTGTRVLPEKYVTKLIGSKKFKDSLKTPGPVVRYMTPKNIVKNATDDNAFKKHQQEAANVINNVAEPHDEHVVHNEVKKNDSNKKTEVKKK